MAKNNKYQPDKLSDDKSKSEASSPQQGSNEIENILEVAKEEIESKRENVGKLKPRVVELEEKKPIAV